MPNILYFDIEIIPKHYETRMAADRSSVACFGYKFDGDKKAKSLCLLDFPRAWEKDPYIEYPLVKAAYNIMVQADVIIGHYSEKFDFPYMCSKFLQYDLDPSKLIHAAAKNDTWRLSKRYLKLSTNRLATIAEFFGLENKTPTDVMWWFRTIQGDAKALKKLNDYCAQDVEVLHNVHRKLRTFEKATRRFNDDFRSCHCCGSKTWVNGRFTTVAGTEKVVLTCSNPDCGRSSSISKAKFEGSKDE